MYRGVQRVATRALRRARPNHLLATRAAAPPAPPAPVSSCGSSSSTTSTAVAVRHYSCTTSSQLSSSTSVLPEMMSTPDPRPSMQQISYTLEVPFAILDVRHGVWADVIYEIEQEHSVNIGRHRNQFQKTILTVHAADEKQFQAASEALRQAHSRVFEEKVPVPDPEAKTRIIGRNGIRMDSVSRKFGVSVRYCEAELMAYIQGDSSKKVQTAAKRLLAYEQQVELPWGENIHLRAEDTAIDAIEHKHSVKISNIPNLKWKQQNIRGNVIEQRVNSSQASINKTPQVNHRTSSKPHSIYIVVGEQDAVQHAIEDMQNVAARKFDKVDLAPWLVHKHIVLPLNRTSHLTKNIFDKWKKKYVGISFLKTSGLGAPKLNEGGELVYYKILKHGDQQKLSETEKAQQYQDFIQKTIIPKNLKNLKVIGGTLKHRTFPPNNQAFLTIKGTEQKVSQHCQVNIFLVKWLLFIFIFFPLYLCIFF